MFVLYILIPIAALFGWLAVARRIPPGRAEKIFPLASAALLTLAYWTWEAQAAGNIRADLILLYPFLFGSYLMFFWRMLKWKALIPALALMAANVGFFIMSYSWFGKYPG
jgi:hypothetical protein